MITKKHFENLLVHSNNLQNIEEMDKFLDTYDFIKLNQEDIKTQNRLIITGN